MKNNTILLCVGLIGLIASGNALKCYHCDSNKENGCKIQAKPDEVRCGNPISNEQVVCVYKAFYEPTGNGHKIHASCETIPSNKPIDPSSIHNCEDEKGIFHVKECRICNHDLCNSASLVDAPFLLRFIIPITFFVSTKLQL